MGHKIGVLLINLGTPDEPTPEAVAKYLKEFLMDPFTIDIPYLFRWFLVNGIIIPKRASLSAHAYEQIWTKQGSPLRFQTELQGKSLQNLLDQDLGEHFGQHFLDSRFFVRAAMRYGNPSFDSILKDFQRKGIDQLIVFPLYPQHAGATTQTAIEKVNRVMKELKFNIPTHFIPSFYSESQFHQLTAKMYLEYLPNLKDYHLLFSFHGLPVRQLKKADLSKAHCYMNPNCCEKITQVNQNCYKAQCYANAKGIAKALQISPSRFSVCFQSRLGKAQWIEPYSEEHMEGLVKSGIDKIVVSSLSFVTDCLENLEEVGIRLKDTFLKAGGKEFVLLPSHNTYPDWIHFIKSKVEQKLFLNRKE